MLALRELVERKEWTAAEAARHYGRDVGQCAPDSIHA
jgi:hypothetical protein